MLALVFIRKLLDCFFSKREMSWLDDLMPESKKKKIEDAEEVLFDIMNELLRNTACTSISFNQIKMFLHLSSSALRRRSRVFWQKTRELCKCHYKRTSKLFHLQSYKQHLQNSSTVYFNLIINDESVESLSQGNTHHQYYR